MRLPLIQIVYIGFTVYEWLIIARIILTWIPQLAEVDALRPVIRFVFDATEPLLRVFRRLIPVVSVGGAGIDFSAFIAIITLVLLRGIIIGILQQIL